MCGVLLRRNLRCAVRRHFIRARHKLLVIEKIGLLLQTVYGILLFLHQHVMLYLHLLHLHLMLYLNLLVSLSIFGL